MGRHAMSSRFAVQIDALNRAWRTLYVGFILDALVAIGVGIAALLGEHPGLGAEFWPALGLLVGKSFLTALGAYLLRLKVTPKPVETAKAVGLVAK